MTTTTISTARGPIKAIHIQVPVGIPTADGGLEIPNRVFLGGIPTETTELELELFFSDFGAVKDVRIVTDRITGECKGYGFVTFDEREEISSLLRKRTILMKGKKLRIRKAIRRNGSQFNNSDSSSEGSPTSSHHMQSNEQVLFVPQQQSAPPPYSHHPLQVGSQTCNMPPGPTMPIPTPMTYPIPQPNYHPVYYFPVMNAQPYQVPLNIPLYHQM